MLLITSKAISSIGSAISCVSYTLKVSKLSSDMQLAAKQLQAVQARLTPAQASPPQDTTAQATQDNMANKEVKDSLLVDPCKQQVERCQQAAEAPAAPKSGVTLGAFLAGRLVEVGVTHAFGVPGDFNLLLLDQLVENKGLKMIWTCNELNAGYAADGYCRRKGVGACVVTYGVGGLSVINACAGCFAEDLPVIFISGGANSNDYAANHTIHHTIGESDLGQQYRAFKEVTCAAEVVRHITEAHHQIDKAISEALRRQKPAYIEICCNLAGLTHPSFTDPPIPIALATRHTNTASLDAAVEAAAAVLASSNKPVLLGGPRLRAHHRRDAFKQLAKSFKGAVATTADAKGMFPEDHEQYIGHYFGSISTDSTCETVEAADVVIAVGAVWGDCSTIGYSQQPSHDQMISVEPDRVTIRGGETFGCIDCEVWTDYSTLGYSQLLSAEKTISVEPDRVTIKGGETFGCIDCEAFMVKLSKVIKPHPASLVNYRRMREPCAPPQLKVQGDKQLSRTALFQQVQEMLTGDSCILAETGDSWFNTLKLDLPAGAGYEIQMRYGSIGWSVGATLGYSLAAQAAGKRLLAFIGDGSFQMTAQDVSTMMRFEANPIIFLINNAGYAIEIEIHDGPYNRIMNWDYCGMVRAVAHHPKSGKSSSKLFTARVETEGQLADAIAAAVSPDRADHLAFIEVVVDTDDVTKELLEFGARVGQANSRKPNPQ